MPVFSPTVVSTWTSLLGPIVTHPEVLNLNHEDRHTDGWTERQNNQPVKYS